MKTRLLLATLLVGLCLSSCSTKKDQTDRKDRDRAASTDPTTKPSDPPKPKQDPSPWKITLDLGNGVTMKMVLIPAGKFLMGSKLSAAQVARRYRRFGGQEADYTCEHPLREVTISKPFYMGIYEVTRPQWRAVMGAGAWDGKACDKPNTGNVANHISWDDASKFCEMLSKTTGRQVALPTEAQWEYACRAGSKTAFCFGDDESKLGAYAWYAANTLGKGEPYPHAAGQKRPNTWGLYDMHGNAWEWCRDWYTESYENAKNIDPENTAETRHRVLRGGQWGLYPDSCRAAYRFKHLPTNRGCSHGFRVVVASPSGAN